jgi:ABC-type transport system involved in multi-copper enzyme maturation permease subunit
MLAASAVVLFLSVGMVRKVALRQATGQLGASRDRRRFRKKIPPTEGTVQETSTGRIRRINGSPTIWRELRTPLFRGHRIAASVAAFACLLVLFVTYYLWHVENDLHQEEIHMMYAAIFTGLGVLFTVVLPATCITSEKESRSWPLLLATTLSDWQIIFGKFVGVLRRCVPIWFLLFGHLILFILAGMIQPVAFIQMTILVAWIVAFLCGTGLYFSSRFKHTTTAVIANFALAGAIWGLMPILLFLVADADYIDDDLAEVYMDTHPFVHAFVVMDGTVRRGHAGDYDWIHDHSRTAFESTIWMLTCMVSYVFLGYMFAWRAKCRLRRNIF